MFAQEQPEPRPFANARDLLQSAGIEENDLHLLVDGQPLSAGEEQPLLRVLQAIRKCPLDQIERLSKAGFDPDQGREASDANRGEIFHLHGEVTAVTVEKLPSEVIDRYDIKQYYRCRVILEPGAEPATILALTVPKSWPLDKEFSERMSCLGVYLKLTPGEVEDVPEPVFAAQRIAWHCDGLLGDLGMDVGLFDDVENKTSIAAAERECFHQLLAAAGKANPQELFHLTDRSPDDDFSVVPLFNEPDKQHGRLVAFTGTARRAILVKLDHKTEADTIRRLGIDRYYQVDMFTADSQGNPLVFCVRDLPAGMPEGPQINELVRIPGFFFKSWAYRPQSPDDKQTSGYQLAPMLIGNQMRWLQVDTNRSSAGQAIAGGLFLIVLMSLFVGVWLTNRGDRKFRQRILSKQS